MPSFYAPSLTPAHQRGKGGISVFNFFLNSLWTNSRFSPTFILLLNVPEATKSSLKVHFDHCWLRSQFSWARKTLTPLLSSFQRFGIVIFCPVVIFLVPGGLLKKIQSSLKRINIFTLLMNNTRVLDWFNSYQIPLLIYIVIQCFCSVPLTNYTLSFNYIPNV